MISADVKADVKQQEVKEGDEGGGIKELVVVSRNF